MPVDTLVCFIALFGSIEWNLIDIVIFVYSYGYVALLVSHFDIPVSIDNLVQWIDPVNDGFELARFDQLFERKQVLELIAAV